MSFRNLVIIPGALGYTLLLWNNRLLSSLWGLSCHIPYGVQVTILVTTAVLVAAVVWIQSLAQEFFHMPRAHPKKKEEDEEELFLAGVP